MSNLSHGDASGFHSHRSSRIHRDRRGGDLLLCGFNFHFTAGRHRCDVHAAVDVLHDLSSDGGSGVFRGDRCQFNGGVVLHLLDYMTSRSGHAFRRGGHAFRHNMRSCSGGMVHLLGGMVASGGHGFS